MNIEQLKGSQGVFLDGRTPAPGRETIGIPMKHCK